MPFKRYVEIGRVGLVNYGPDYGKLVVIVDVIDQNRALVDSPDMVRSQLNFKRLTLTDIKIDIKRVPNKKTLIAALEAADVKNKWENSSWGRKLIVQKKRASLNDFDRFKIMLAKIKKAGVVRQELAKLKKETTATHNATPPKMGTKMKGLVRSIKSISTHMFDDEKEQEIAIGQPWTLSTCRILAMMDQPLSHRAG
nr:60S ribosomal protein L14-2-like [Tanacetum cinerariifolium]